MIIPQAYEPERGARVAGRRGFYVMIGCYNSYMNTIYTMI